MAIEQYFFIVLAVIVLQVELGLAGSYSTVEYLPGFEGPLPFQLQTGYVGVDEAEEVQLFYYFLKSEGNVKEDPLLLWLTGGPGCSALSGLLYEVGPLTFEVVEYNGSLPKLILNPHSWTKAASIIFVDMPVGTGFSYAKTQPAYHSSDLIQVHQADQFLRKWLRDHPEFLPSPVYIAGDSYSGIPLPAIVQQISNGNEEGMEPLINLKVLFKKKKKNLKGYILGNPITDPNFDTNSKVSYAHGMGLISDELYESLKRSCRGNYVDIEPSNTECLRNMQGFNKCVEGLQTGYILEPSCGFASPKPFEIFDKRRSLIQNSPDFLQIDPTYPSFGCPAYGYVLSYIWVNDSSVREALHIREGSIEQWVRCNTELSYTSDIPISLVYHVSLGKKGYRSLIYSGDQDMVVPFLGTQAWIRSLNYSIVDDWRPWLVRGQIAGYTRTYSNQMTFATVKGGGHTAPTYKPEVCFAMFKRWKSHEPL
ncbi:serine carboxypeptidase-like 17 isoform X1 [Jatropha curcas]|uniref:serine carboxypeptidase-like 17 isoform X1 n=1 Tax=Jatropha curcas TaxID=180498 RepID=UPI0005FBB2D9|nr:serine carboxypeptidase-like 17 isoform X1 [Jatropha curcas]